MVKVMAMTITIITIGLCSYAQEGEDNPQNWKTHAEASLGLAQATYSDNWTGGVVGSVIWASNFLATAERQLSAQFKLENALRLEFGQTHNQDKETKKWASPVKSTDKIRFDTILKLTLNAWADPYVAGTFESQFYDATYPQKRFYINPIKLTESVGASKPLFESQNGKAFTRLGFALREDIFKVYDAANDETTTESTYDGGVEWVTDLIAQLSEGLNYTSKLTVFQALFYSESDEIKGTEYEDYWKTTDAKWENLLTARLAKIVQVSLSWELIYDKDVSLAGQFKETLALGVAWVL